MFAFIEKNILIAVSPNQKEFTAEKIIEFDGIKNPYFDGNSIIERPPTPKEAGEIIIKKNFDGNINAQLAALSKSNIKMLAVLAKVVGLPTIQAVFAEEIAMARAISETRVLCGLSAFDLSFLE